jgi:hypothetical protein
MGRAALKKRLAEAEAHVAAGGLFIATQRGVVARLSCADDEVS